MTDTNAVHRQLDQLEYEIRNAESHLARLKREYEQALNRLDRLRDAALAYNKVNKDEGLPW